MLLVSRKARVGPPSPAVTIVPAALATPVRVMSAMSFRYGFRFFLRAIQYHMGILFKPYLYYSIDEPVGRRL